MTAELVSREVLTTKVEAVMKLAQEFGARCSALQAKMPLAVSFVF